MNMERKGKPLLPVIAGPTASGKTACAVELCKLMDGEVVSADSMQVYRGMEILSAVPTVEEQQGIPHHMMGIVDPADRFTADAYGEAAKASISDILSRGRMPVLCGGTGLYIDAVTRPMSFSQQSDQALHAQLLQLADEPGGRQKLHHMLEEIDPDSAARLHENDVRRVSRAIEIFRLTGMTQTEHTRKDKQRSGDYREVIFALDWPREVLYRRIDRRVGAMVEAGLIDEVRALMANETRHPTAMQAIGYRQVAAALRGEISMDEAIDMTKQASRNFAKRQLTWFRRDERVIWLPAEDRDAPSLARAMQDHILKQTLV